MKTSNRKVATFKTSILVEIIIVCFSFTFLRTLNNFITKYKFLIFVKIILPNDIFYLLYTFNFIWFLDPSNKLNKTELLKIKNIFTFTYASLIRPQPPSHVKMSMQGIEN